MLYRFDSFTLDLTRGCLEVAGREVELRPKCFDVLLHLLENDNKLISKAALAAAVWPQAAVSDELLARCISDVRAAIADHEHTIIKTVPRRGYLFTADVTRHAHVGPGQQQSGPEVVTGHTPTEPSLTENSLAERPSIAVLAFTNMSGDPDQEYFSDGITEDIITGLSRFSELFVIARNSSFQYKGKSVDMRQVGRELGVRYVLEGSIRRAGDRVRISAQLIDAVTGAHRWAERYDRKLEDVFAVQDEVSRTIVAVLVAHVNKAETERTLAKPPAAWQAYDHYLRAAHTFTLVPFLVQQTGSSPDTAQAGPGLGHRPQLRPCPCHPFQEFHLHVGSPMRRCASLVCGHRRRPSFGSRSSAARPQSV